jgi:hypothetical protein
VAVGELTDGVAEARATLVVRHRGRRRQQRGIGVVRPQHGGEPRQAGAEAEDLDVVAGPHGHVGKAQQRSRVRRHRPRDVDQEHDAPTSLPRRAMGQHDRLTAGAQRLGHRSAQVELTASARPATTRPPRRTPQPQRVDEAVGLDPLVVRELGQVLVLQHLDRAPPQDLVRRALAAVALTLAGVDAERARLQHWSRTGG